MKVSRRYPAFLAAVVWLALAWHLLTGIFNEPFTPAGIGTAIARFLSFFTILSNILVAVSLTGFVRSGQRALFAKPRFAGAIVTYIGIVELVYTGSLRWFWHPTPLQLVNDILLHDVVAIGYVIFWWKFIPKGTLRAIHVLPWLAFPLAFAVYNNLYVNLTGEKNPYSFLDLRTLGVGWVSLFLVILMLLFLAVGLFFVRVDQVYGRNSEEHPFPAI
jgi:hypothetical protein